MTPSYILVLYLRNGRIYDAFRCYTMTRAQTKARQVGAAAGWPGGYAGIYGMQGRLITAAVLHDVRRREPYWVFSHPGVPDEMPQAVLPLASRGFRRTRIKKILKQRSAPIPTDTRLVATTALTALGTSWVFMNSFLRGAQSVPQRRLHRGLLQLEMSLLNFSADDETLWKASLAARQIMDPITSAMTNSRRREWLLEQAAELIQGLGLKELAQLNFESLQVFVEKPLWNLTPRFKARVEAGGERQTLEAREPCPETGAARFSLRHVDHELELRAFEPPSGHDAGSLEVLALRQKHPPKRLLRAYSKAGKLKERVHSDLEIWLARWLLDLTHAEHEDIRSLLEESPCRS